MSAAIVTLLATGSSSQASRVAFVATPARPHALLPQPTRTAGLACPVTEGAVPTPRLYSLADPRSPPSGDDLSSRPARHTRRAVQPRSSLRAAAGENGENNTDNHNSNAFYHDRHGNKEREQRQTQQRASGGRSLRGQQQSDEGSNFASYYSSTVRDFTAGHIDPITDKPLRSTQSREQELARRGSANVAPGIGDPVPVEEYDWRQSVFEFRSLNDPKSNLSTRSSRYAREPSLRPARMVNPPRPSATAQPPFAGNEAAAPAMDAFTPAAVDDRTLEWLRFREKEALRRTEEVDDKVKRLSGPRAVTTELATQLGLPASSSYDEIRKAYRAEIKRCHPDAATLEDNEFKARALENRFMQLSAAWENFVQAHKVASTFGNGPADNGAEEWFAPTPANGPAKKSTRSRSTDEDAEEVFGEVLRTRYVVHNDADMRSHEAAGAVAAVNMGRKVSPRAKMSSKSPTRYTSDEDVEEFLDTGGCSC